MEKYKKGDGKGMEHIIRMALLETFREELVIEERSDLTIEKYVRDVRAFLYSMGEDAVVTKESVIRYKRKLTETYTPASANSMIAALNRFFRMMEWYDCTVRSLKIQRSSFRSENKELSKEEYKRLLKAARGKKDERMYLLMETLGSTGIRISELPFVTVEAVMQGRARVSLKGKTRQVLLPMELRRKLRAYAEQKKINTGSIFITRTGRPMDRSNVLHAMKRLAVEAGVIPEKVFPHNLRHLFACTYYQKEKDLSHLADLLGHSNINTTRIYTCISGEEQEVKLKNLGLVI